MGSGRGRLPRFLQILILLAGTPLGAAWLVVPALAEDWDAPRIRTISVTGNHAIPDSRIVGVMRHSEPASFNPFSKPRFLGRDVLAQDLLSILELYRQEGFPFARILDAAVVYEESQEFVSIQIALDEGNLVRVRFVRLEGVGETLRGKVRQGIELVQGGPLQTKVVRQDQERILSILAEEGMAVAEVKRTVEYLPDSLFADVTYTVKEGPLVRLRHIEVENQDDLRTRGTVIRKVISLKSGDVLRRSRLADSQTRLYRTGLFRSVRLTPEVDSLAADSGQETVAADLRIRVSEKAPAWYGAGGGFSSNDEVRALVEWGHRNLWGRWRVLQVNGRLKYSVDRELNRSLKRDRALVLREGFANTTVTEPFLFGTQLFSQSELYYDFEREIDYEQTILGVIQSFRRELARHLVGRFSLELRFVNTTDTASFRENYETHLATVILDHDTRDSFFDPARGHSYRGVIDYAGGFLGGRNEFLRTTAGASWHVPLRREAVAAFRVRAGLITPLGDPESRLTSERGDIGRVPAEDRYRLGGGTTVRGYKEETLGRRSENGQPLGGLAMFVANLEIRFPLFWRFQGAFFMDMGNVWADASEFKLSRFREGLRSRPYDPLAVAYSLGMGIRLKTPVGPVRVDYGFKVGRDPFPGDPDNDVPADPPQEIHVSLGQPF